MLTTITSFYNWKHAAATAVSLTIWIAVLLLVQGNAAQSNLYKWSGNGPNAYVSTVVGDPFDPNIVYAGSPDGVFKSVNGGSSWFLVNAMGVFGFEADFVNPNTFYTTSEKGIVKSSDGDATWKSVNDEGELLAVARSNPNVIYAYSW